MSFSNCFRNKKILVTGHTGFKGSWLSIWLKELGAKVYGFALPPYTPEDNFVRTNLDKEIVHREGDVRDLPELKAYFQEVQPDFAFHLAAQPLVLPSYKDPQSTFETNLMGVVNFFEAVRNTPSVRVAVNVTSDKCYDNKEWVWGYRENDPMGGKDPYSASKGAAELITASYIHSFFSAETSCAVASARAGNVIGGGDWAQDRIIPDFFRAIKEGKELFLRNPAATRPWQHVLEPLSGYLNLATALYNEGRQYSGGWNFGPEDNANYSVQQLIDKIISMFGRGAYSTPTAIDKPHEANILKLDISKASKYLGWLPCLTFEETVSFTIKGYEADLTNGCDILISRRNQIKEYTELAARKKLPWTN